MEVFPVCGKQYLEQKAGSDGLADGHLIKAKQDNAMWKHVQPRFTTFAWLSQSIAEAFNWEALARDGDRGIW